MKTRLISRFICSLALLACAPIPAVRAAAFSEPPAVIYGKVFHIGEGGAYQLFRGTLKVTLVNERDAAHAVTRTVQLGDVGANGAFSYRLEIPQAYLPHDAELPGVLAVGHQQSHYQIGSLTVDGRTAVPVDATQQTRLLSSFANRAIQHRLDLQVNLPQVDADGDGIPDWWEDRHGFNRHSALDAALDADGDGLTNLEEYRLGTDPNSPNHGPIVKTTSVVVPVGGQAGLYLLIVDQDTPPANLILTCTNPVSGVTWRRSGIELPPGTPFTYADVLAGSISLEAAPDFQGAHASIVVEEGISGGTTSVFSVEIKALSPQALQPAIWLHAGTLSTNGPVAEWADASDHNRDGFQPNAQARPTAVSGENVVFFPGQFLYLDDQDLSLETFTAFLTFDLSDVGAEGQSLFSSPALQLGIGGEADGTHARSLHVTQAGRMIRGPVLKPGQLNRILLASGPDGALLLGPDQSHFAATPSSQSPLSTFTTLGGLQRLSDAGAHQFLNGGVREFLVFNKKLAPAGRARIEDYRRARWEGWLIWDHRGETSPATIQGAPDTRNLLIGGWSDDTLTGGTLSDVLRGGPGSNRLTGGGDADRFEVFPDSGNDLITDFSIADGDVLDLTAVFWERTGSPDQYLNVRAQVIRGADNVPVVHTKLELDHEGDGGAPDQVITLAGVAIGNSDLRRLVGEGTIQLGGPRFATPVWVTTAETNLIRTEIPREIRVVRSGNLDAAIKVPLSFTGTATIDDDYRLEGASGTGAVRTVSFARGAAETDFRLIPLVGAPGGSETVAIHVLASPFITETPDTPLVLTLDPASFLAILAIQTVRHVPADGANPGLVRVTRTGRMDQSLEIPLEFAGNLINGQHYDALPHSLTFAPGQAVGELEVRLKNPRPIGEQVDEVQIALQENAARYVLAVPRRASVIVLPASLGAGLSFAQWKELAPGGNTNLMIYVTGNDSGPGAAPVRIQNAGGQVELYFTTIAGLTDVSLSVMASGDLSHWEDVTHRFTTRLRWLGDARVERSYRFMETMGPKRFYRIKARYLEP